MSWYIPDKVRLIFRGPEDAVARMIDQWKNPETDAEQETNERLVREQGVFSIEPVAGQPNEIAWWVLNRTGIAFEEIDTLWITTYQDITRYWHAGGGVHYPIAFRTREAAEHAAGQFPRKRGLNVEQVNAEWYQDCTILLDGKIVTLQEKGAYQHAV